MRKMGLVVISPSPASSTGPECLKNKHSLGILPAKHTPNPRNYPDNYPDNPSPPQLTEGKLEFTQVLEFLGGIPGHLGCRKSATSAILQQEILIIP